MSEIGDAIQEPTNEARAEANVAQAERRAELARAIPSEEEEDEVN